MKNAPVRHAVEYVFYRAFRALLLRVPHPRVRGLGHRLGRLSYRLVGGQRRRTLRHLELAMPELSAGERQRLARSCFEHFGAHFLELISMSRFGREAAGELFDVEGFEHVEALTAAGRGFFLTAGHYGHWELALYPLAARIADLQAVARAPDNPRIARDVRAMRERLGIGMVDKAGASFRMFKAHRNGACVAVVIDQHVRPSAGVLVPFLGHPAWSSPVLAMLSLRTGAPVVHVTCVAAPGGRYRVTLRPPIEPEGEGPGAEESLTRRYMEEIERDIRRRPELWLWMHRRWRAGTAPAETAPERRAAPGAPRRVESASGRRDSPGPPASRAPHAFPAPRPIQAAGQELRLHGMRSEDAPRSAPARSRDRTQERTEDRR